MLHHNALMLAAKAARQAGYMNLPSLRGEPLIAKPCEVTFRVSGTVTGTAFFAPLGINRDIVTLTVELSDPANSYQLVRVTGRLTKIGTTFSVKPETFSKTQNFIDMPDALSRYTIKEVSMGEVFG